MLIATNASAQDWRDSLRAARQAYNQGQFNEAQRKFNAAQQLAPGDVDLTKDIGTSAYRNSDYKTAEDAFLSSARKTDDLDARARKFHNAGNAQMKQKNYKEAIQSYKEALRANPSNEETRYNLAEAQRRLKKDQEQQQEQNQQENQQNQDDQNDQGDGQSNDGQNQQSDQNNQSDSQNQNQQNNQNSSSNQSGSDQQKLSDKKTERMLDELMKKEMETKRRMQGMGSGADKEEVKSGKRW